MNVFLNSDVTVLIKVRHTPVDYTNYFRVW